jgi:type IV secretory pathway VirB10-like protein
MELDHPADTLSLTLENLAGTDAAGYAGLEDGVDRHGIASLPVLR